MSSNFPFQKSQNTLRVLQCERIIDHRVREDASVIRLHAASLLLVLGVVSSDVDSAAVPGEDGSGDVQLMGEDVALLDWDTGV